MEPVIQASIGELRFIVGQAASGSDKVRSTSVRSTSWWQRVVRTSAVASRYLQNDCLVRLRAVGFTGVKVYGARAKKQLGQGIAKFYRVALSPFEIATTGLSCSNVDQDRNYTYPCITKARFSPFRPPLFFSRFQASKSYMQGSRSGVWMCQGLGFWGLSLRCNQSFWRARVAQNA